jgi:hypothetical protein
MEGVDCFFYKPIIPLGLNYKNEPLFFSPRRGEVFYAFPAGEGRDGAKKHYFFLYHVIHSVLLTGRAKMDLPPKSVGS